MFDIEKQLPEIMVEQTRKNERRKDGDQEDRAVRCFNSPFGTIAHAMHAAFAIKRPERAVVNGFNGFHRTRFDAQSAVIAIGRSVVGFGKEKATNKIVA